MSVCFTLPDSSTQNFGATGALDCTDFAYTDDCNGTDPCYFGDWGTFDEGCYGGDGIQTFNNGTGTVSGTWTLMVHDNAGIDAGVINDFTLVFEIPPDSCDSDTGVSGTICGNNTLVPIPDNNPGNPAQSVIVNSGAAGNMGFGTEIERVCILINHSFIDDLDIYLTEPDGSTIILSTDNGGSSNNYGDIVNGTEMCFTPQAAASVTQYDGGDTGDFRPEGDFGAFNGPANGNWTLTIGDDTNGDLGSLISWSIIFGNGDCATGCRYVYNIDTTICEGDSLFFGGIFRYSEGTFIDTADLGAGCDSIVRLTISLQPPITNVLEAVICAGDSFSFNGSDYYYTTGIYQDTFISAIGCDSIVTYDLTVLEKGLLAANFSNYLQVDPLTASTQRTLNTAILNTGWINGCFTIHQEDKKLYWINDLLYLTSMDIATGSATSVPSDISTLGLFWGLSYYDGYLYLLTVSTDMDKMLIRMDPSTGLLDNGFSGIEINGTADLDILLGSSPVIESSSGKYYLPMRANTLLEFDIPGLSGRAIALTGAVAEGSSVELLEIDVRSGTLYGLSGFTDIVRIIPGPADTAVADLVKTLSNASGYINPSSTFDSDNSLYIFQAAEGCGSIAPLVSVDVESGTEWCSPVPGVPFSQLEYFNCPGTTGLRTSGQPAPSR